MNDTADLYLGESPAWRELLQRVRAFAPNRHEVVLRGATGTGKAVVARLLHQHSRRAGQFVECAIPMIPASLQHSTLSGYARHAFTDAREDRPGLIEHAHRGTLFRRE